MLFAAVALGEKGLHGELNAAEELTGILLTALLLAALPGGGAVFTHLHRKLSAPLQPDGGELADGHIQPLSLDSKYQRLVKAFSNDLGWLGQICLAAAALAVLGYSQAEINVALKGIDMTELSLEQIIKAALKKMMKV